MDTYGDLVTLLLTFFVLLFSFSNLDAAKWQALVGSFTGTSVVGIDPISPEVAIESPIERFGPRSGMPEEDPLDPPDPSDPSDPGDVADPGDAVSNLWAIYDHLGAFIASNDVPAEIEIYEDEFVIKLIIPDLVFFETASAVVQPEAYPVLDMVIDMFLEVEHLYFKLSVEGHTDSRPINTPQYPSNWHVSVYRAVNVVAYIRDDGRLDVKRLVALGYGEEHPIAPNDTPENMARNRRVEFVVEAVGRRVD